ncbi:hypothetical protein JB92DRAFT_2972052 [Gautieria morchelliformis]|nr:hypothetical protein JB92DRAFT_2972052 [Gautieria morchelliformis]
MVLATVATLLIHNHVAEPCQCRARRTMGRAIHCETVKYERSAVAIPHKWFVGLSSVLQKSYRFGIAANVLTGNVDLILTT